MVREAVVVADSGPLIGLARIDQLQLLPALAARVLLPQAVWNEVTVAKTDAPGALVISQATWIEVHQVDPKQVELLTLLLDPGEAEAIALAHTLPDCLVLLDDSRARRVAEYLGVRRMGTVGLLRRAKQAGLIERLRPQLEALKANGIHIRQELVDAVLREVGEE